jgi:protein involved in temperature-dependent protein secretion
LQIDVALRHLKTAVRLEPSKSKLRHSLGKAYEAAERWQDALDQYQFAAEKDPSVTRFQMSMVKPLTRLQRLTRVVEVLPMLLHAVSSPQTDKIQQISKHERWLVPLCCN